MPSETFLTEMQARVLGLRAKGLSQAEIARMLKTSRANICILERRARENIARAERTLALAARLRAPVVLAIKTGEDVLDIPERLLKAADVAKVKVVLSTPEIIARIREQASNKLKGRYTTKGFNLVLTAEGELLIS